MEFSIEGSFFDAEKVIYRDQGYSSDPGIPLLGYKFNISNHDLLNIFDISYEEFTMQCIQDDEFTPESDIPIIKNLNYPSLSEMLNKHRKEFCYLIKNYLYFQILNDLFAKNKRSDWEFSINEISNINDNKIGFIFTGKGYYIYP